METIKQSWLIALIMLLLLAVAPVQWVAAEDAAKDEHSAETTHEETSDEHGAEAEHGDGHSAESEPIVAQFSGDSAGIGTGLVLGLLALILILLGVVAVIGAVSLGLIGIGFVSVSESDG